MNASGEPGEDSFQNKIENINKNTIVPIFYIGGELSTLPELPVQSERL